MAPGTWGSLPPAVVFGALMYGGASPVVTAAVMGVMAVFGSVACLCCAPVSIAAVGEDDPGEVVMDEFAAQALMFLAIPLLLPRALSHGESLFFALLGFLLFRAFDILKPGPIRMLERLPSGWGILADDLASGVCSAVILSIVAYLTIRP